MLTIGMPSTHQDPTSTRLEALATDLNSAAIHLLRRIRRSDEAMGITPSKASALSVLVFGGPCSLSALAAVEQVTPPSMSRTVANLESVGFVRCEVDTHDRRALVIHATPKAKRLLERGRRLRVEPLVTELQGLSVSNRLALERAVEVLRHLEKRAGGG